jgi:hypothetical protein
LRGLKVGCLWSKDPSFFGRWMMPYRLPNARRMLLLQTQALPEQWPTLHPFRKSF